MKKKNKKIWIWSILLFLWLAVIFGHSAMPASMSREESLGIFAVLQKIFPWLTHGLLRKLGHLCEFGVLGILLTGTFRQFGKGNLFFVFSCALFTAFCDETLQLFVEGRSGEVRDIWIDLAGAVLGALFTTLLFRLKKGKK